MIIVLPFFWGGGGARTRKKATSRITRGSVRRDWHAHDASLPDLLICVGKSTCWDFFSEQLPLGACVCLTPLVKTTKLHATHTRRMIALSVLEDTYAVKQVRSSSVRYEREKGESCGDICFQLLARQNTYFVAQHLRFDQIQWTPVHLDQTIAPLAVGNSSCRFLIKIIIINLVVQKKI